MPPHADLYRTLKQLAALGLRFSLGSRSNGPFERALLQEAEPDQRLAHRGQRHGINQFPGTVRPKSLDGPGIFMSKDDVRTVHQTLLETAFLEELVKVAGVPDSLARSPAAADVILAVREGVACPESEQPEPRPSVRRRAGCSPAGHGFTAGMSGSSRAVRMSWRRLPNTIVAGYRKNFPLICHDEGGNPARD